MAALNAVLRELQQSDSLAALTAQLRQRYARLGYRDLDEVQWPGKHYRTVLMVKPLAAPAPSAQDDDAPERFFGNSTFRFDGARVAEVEEYWATAEPPPAWRRAAAIGACERI